MAKRQSMTEKVLEALREDIINGVYEENDMITEAEISEKFGVSKTPSREALNYLCMEGFLDKIPNKGYLFRGLSVAELQSLTKLVVLTGAQVPIGQMFTDAKRNLQTAFAALDAGLSGVMMAFDDKIMGDPHFERRNLLPKLKKLTDHGVSIAVCSQCLYEKSDLSLYEMGRKLLDCGVIPGRDMTTEAIVTKMMWALGQTEYPAEVKEIFARNYCGEVS